MDDLKTIRRAITAHRGGLEAASDAAILRLWRSLDATTQQSYLAGETVSTVVAEPETEDGTDADSSGPESDV